MDTRLLIFFRTSTHREWDDEQEEARPMRGHLRYVVSPSRGASPPMPKVVVALPPNLSMARNSLASGVGSG